MSVRSFPDLSRLSRAAADFFIKSAREAIADRGEFKVALAGGNTPKALYSLLTSEPFVEYVEWPKVKFFFGDERFISPSDEQSNEHTARSYLLTPLKINESQIFSMVSDADMSSTPAAAANRYEHVFKEQLKGEELDLVLLGMGDDGHTASLFPGIAELQERAKDVVATISPKGVRDRVTLTIPPLTQAQCTLFLVGGADKAVKLRECLTAPMSEKPPAGVVAALAKRAVWYVDDAASDLVQDLCERG